MNVTNTLTAGLFLLTASASYAQSPQELDDMSGPYREAAQDAYVLVAAEADSTQLQKLDDIVSDGVVSLDELVEMYGMRKDLYGDSDTYSSIKNDRYVVVKDSASNGQISYDSLSLDTIQDIDSDGNHVLSIQEQKAYRKE